MPLPHCYGEQKPVNFNTVAKAACVSKAYLYSQLDLRERIETLRQQGAEQTIRERATHPTGKTDASRDLVLLAKDRRIKELEARFSMFLSEEEKEYQSCDIFNPPPVEPRE